MLPSYPTEEDILFEIVDYLTEKEKLTEEWSDQGIRSVLHCKDITVEELGVYLESLVRQGFLTGREGAGKRRYYRVLKHPFN
jgi:hypothetical protein